MACKVAVDLRTVDKVVWLNPTPSLHIHGKREIASMSSPFCEWPEMTAFQTIKSLSEIKSKTNLASSIKAHLAYISISPTPRKESDRIFIFIKLECSCLPSSLRLIPAQALSALDKVNIFGAIPNIFIFPNNSKAN
uniref:Uncharacterized protein n=1 Tax=Rhizophora mucronata TaxID=61149 RepID=A0A2P2IPT2_RHIMU